MKNRMAALALATAVAITATTANAGSVVFAAPLDYQSQIAKGWAGEGVVMCTPVS